MWPQDSVPDWRYFVSAAIPVECGVVDYDLYDLIDASLQPLWFLVKYPDLIQFEQMHDQKTLYGNVLMPQSS